MTIVRLARYSTLRLFRNHTAFAGRKDRFRWAVIILFLLHSACVLFALLSWN